MNLLCYEIVGLQNTAFDFEIFSYLQGGVCNRLSDMSWRYRATCEYTLIMNNLSYTLQRLKSHINLHLFNIDHENNIFLKPRQRSVEAGGTEGPIETTDYPNIVGRSHHC